MTRNAKGEHGREWINDTMATRESKCTGEVEVERKDVLMKFQGRYVNEQHNLHNGRQLEC